MPWLRLHNVILTSWLLVWFTLPLWNVGNSISIALLALTVIVYSVYHGISFRKSDMFIPILFALLFGTYVYSELLFTGSWPPWYMAKRKLSLLVIPLVMLLLPFSREILRRYAVKALAISLLLAGVVMLAESTVQFVHSGDWTVFTYHALTEPWPAGAIYLSLFLSVLIVMLIRYPDDLFPGRINAMLLLFFGFLLLLCASKLFISLTVPVLLYYLIRYRTQLVTVRPLYTALAMVAILIFSYPFFQRMSVLIQPEFDLITQEKFDASTELNGINLRLIQWRFGWEILNQQDAWWSGVGMSSRQQLLDTRYTEAGLYTGSGESGDTGFLGYNFHNQWLETLVGSGLPALLLLLCIVVLRFTAGPQYSLFPLIPVLFLLGFFLTESVMERQVGLVFFCLLFSYLRPAS